MKDLSQYPISFPYGSTDPPYTATHFHRGDDRAAPVNTPIIIQGVTIGFVGMTGFATGYHCHNQEWQGSKTNVRKPQNFGKGGTVIEVDSIGNTGDGSFGKYVTLRNDDGWNTSYCHMNSTNAKVGDIIKQGEEPMSTWSNGDTYNLLFHACNAAIAKRAQDANYVGYFGLQNGMESEKAFNDIISSPQFDFLVAEARKDSIGADPTVIVNGTEYVPKV